MVPAAPRRIVQYVNNAPGDLEQAKANGGEWKNGMGIRSRDRIPAVG